MTRKQLLNERIEDLIAAVTYRQIDLETLLVYARQADRKDLLKIIEAAEKYNRAALNKLRELRGKTEHL